MDELTDRMLRRSVPIFIVCFTILFPSLFSNIMVNLAEVRPPFFILKKIKNPDLIKERLIFSSEGEYIGEFRVLSISGDEILCKSLAHKNGISGNCYVKIFNENEKLIPVEIKRSTPSIPFVSGKKNDSKKIFGIRFMKGDDNLFVTEHPVPATIIPNLSFAGIDKFLKRVEEKNGSECIVGLMTSNEMRKYIKPGEELILLGWNGISPGLFFFSDTGIRENPVSEKIIKKLKYKIFIPLKLKML